MRTFKFVLGACAALLTGVSTAHAEPIKINVFYWWDVLIERTDPKVNVEFLGVGIRGAAS